MCVRSDFGTIPLLASFEPILAKNDASLARCLATSRLSLAHQRVPNPPAREIRKALIASPRRRPLLLYAAFSTTKPGALPQPAFWYSTTGPGFTIHHIQSCKWVSSDGPWVNQYKYAGSPPWRVVQCRFSSRAYRLRNCKLPECRIRQHTRTLVQLQVHNAHRRT
ncbi:hypothetical protein GE09DRAFT_1098798 [Coniochaeta sp. 2T2.1]|nr:hypothetical protein GE09DRAFT_1098798 [Coniochaeta sp. 2T2.1]